MFHNPNSYIDDGFTPIIDASSLDKAHDFPKVDDIVPDIVPDIKMVKLQFEYSNKYGELFWKQIKDSRTISDITKEQGYLLLKNLNGNEYNANTIKDTDGKQIYPSLRAGKKNKSKNIRKQKKRKSRRRHRRR